MALSVELGDGGVVCVLVGHVERTLDVAAVGVLPLLVEYLGVQVDVVVVDGAVEGDGDHLRDSVAGAVPGAEASRDLGAVIAAEEQLNDSLYDSCDSLPAEAVGQRADGGVTLGGAVGVIFLVCHK